MIFLNIVDILFIFIALWWYYGVSLAIFSLLGAVGYIVWTILVTEKQKYLRKKLNKTEGVVYSNAIDTLLNFESV